MSLLAATLPVAAGDSMVTVTSYFSVTRYLLAAALLRLAAALLRLAAALLRLAAALPHAHPHAAAADPPLPKEGCDPPRPAAAAAAAAAATSRS